MDHHAFPPNFVKLQKGFCLNVGKVLHVNVEWFLEWMERGRVFHVERCFPKRKTNKTNK
jgi:hypothetical protein